MRQIKFRYKDTDGDYYYKEPTLPGDAKQLVGYDRYGREVYEGDVLEIDVENHHLEYTARLHGYDEAPDSGIYRTDIHKLNLKGADK